MTDWSRREALCGATAFVASAAGSVGQSQASLLSVEVLDPSLKKIIASQASFQQLADGFTWAEGPAWDRVRSCLYFSDVPENKAYRWSAQDGLSVFLSPSGIDPAEARGFREPGSNGLWSDDQGFLYICNHGRRAVERMDVVSKARTAIVSDFESRAFNSPNDLVFARDGTLFFTDPPYGLEGLTSSPLKDMAENGVYRVSTEGEVSQILDDMTFPNGIALSPDESFLYVAQSDPDDHYIRRVGFDASGRVNTDERWFEASSLLAAGQPGLCDGMAVAADGTVFATGPGGVLILDPEGTLLGRLVLGAPTGNCTFGEDGRSLFITSGHRLVKVRTKVRGVRWS